VWLDRSCWEKVSSSASEWQADVVVLDPWVDAGCRVLKTEAGATHIQHKRWGAVRLPLCARHQVALALVAARIAMEHGVRTEDIQQRLTQLQAPQGRLTISTFEQVTVIDDAYNANPASMRAALGMLGGWQQAERRVAVLGSMKELGPGAEVLHRQVGCQVVENGIDMLIGVGSGGAWIAASVGDQVETRVVDDSSAAAAILAGYLQPKDVLLLKASRSEALERVITHLREIRAQNPGNALADGGVEA
jgi:UDP-N-acetylmuramoyl-tripeptide--D-alanyl-D-alanine ligase